jgi:hypothetical protein
MKRYGRLPWLLTGFILILAAIAIMQSIELTWTSMVSRGAELQRPWHGPHAPSVVVRSSPDVHLNLDWVPLLFKLGLFALGAALWAKGAGILRWGGGALASLVLLGQFPVLAGLALIALAVWIAFRPRGTGTLTHRTRPIASITQRPQAAYESGAWLDEWELKQQREEPLREDDEHGRTR